MKRLCTTCHAHEALADSNLCRSCFETYLRQTRSASMAPVSPWVQRMRENRGVGKVFA